MSAGQRSAREREASERDSQETSDDDQPERGGTTSPVQGQSPGQDDRYDREAAADPVTTEDSDDGLDQTSTTTSPIAGNVRPESEYDQTPEGISDQEAISYQREVASQAEGVFYQDVSLQREQLSEEDIEQLRRDEAAERNVSPEQIEFEETPYEITAEISEQGQERAAETEVASRYEGVEPVEIQVDITDGSTETSVLTDEATQTIAEQQRSTDDTQTQVWEGPEQTQSGQALERDLQEGNVPDTTGTTPAMGQTTDPAYDPSAESPGFAGAFIDRELAERIGQTETVLPSGFTSRLQDAGSYVGAGIESTVSDASDTLTDPIPGAAGSATDAAITGVLGTSARAVAETPGDAALLGERAIQAGTVGLRDPSEIPSITQTTVGYAGASAEATAETFAAEPIQQTAAAGALLGGTALATQGARATASSIDDVVQTRRYGTEIDFESPGQRTIQRERGSPETRREQAEAPQTDVDAESFVLEERNLAQQVDYDPYSTTRQQSLGVSDSLLRAGTGSALVSGEIGRLESAQRQTVSQDTGTQAGTGMDLGLVPGLDTGQGTTVGQGSVVDTDQEYEPILTTQATTTQETSQRSRPRRPPLPELDLTADSDGPPTGDPMSIDTDVSIGDYIDIL